MLYRRYLNTMFISLFYFKGCLKNKNFLKQIFIACLLFSSFSLQAKNNSQKKSGYRYIIDNYFSKRVSSGKYYDYSRAFTLSSGFSIYRASKDKDFKPFSSLNVSFTQTIKEINFLGDLHLKVSMFSSQMPTQKATLLEVTPFISIPEIQTTFPFYIGMGLGVGFYPRYLIQKLPSASINTQLFVGLRFLEIYYNLGFFTELNLKIHYPLSEMKVYLSTISQWGFIFRF